MGGGGAGLSERSGRVVEGGENRMHEGGGKMEVEGWG